MNDFLALYQIIIIDDEPWALNYMKKIFERRDLGFHICAAVSNAEAALKLIPSVHPHVVITDIQMSKITGLELLQRIKETAPECEVVIVSAYSNFDYAREALRHHAFDYCVNLSVCRMRSFCCKNCALIWKNITRQQFRLLMMRMPSQNLIQSPNPLFRSSLFISKIILPNAFF